MTFKEYAAAQWPDCATPVDYNLLERVFNDARAAMREQAVQVAEGADAHGEFVKLRIAAAIRAIK
jgi:hypothetical protein